MTCCGFGVCDCCSWCWFGGRLMLLLLVVFGVYLVLF